jgi:hypothetical protein
VTIVPVKRNSKSGEVYYILVAVKRVKGNVDPNPGCFHVVMRSHFFSITLWRRKLCRFLVREGVRDLHE